MTSKYKKYNEQSERWAVRVSGESDRGKLLKRAKATGQLSEWFWDMLEQKSEIK